MSQKCFIVTISVYIGHNCFEEKATNAPMDIDTVFTSFEEANLHIDKSIERNQASYDRQSGEGVITHETVRPDFFQGRQVEARYTDHRDQKQWTHEYSIFERTLYTSADELVQCSKTKKREITLNQWKDELIWCPSQCYYYFRDNGGALMCLYLRWRHDNPWTAELIPVDESGEFGAYELWKNLNPPFFKDSELDALKKWCLKELNI